MSSSAAPAELPDAVVYAIRHTSKAFAALQSSRYPATGPGFAAAATANEENPRAIVMRTKSPIPRTADPLLDAAGDVPSTWCEIYRRAAGDVSDMPSQRLWGLVTVVLRLLEQGGTADGVNASAAVVDWAEHFSDAPSDVQELRGALQHAHPLQMEEDAVVSLGSAVLGSLEGAFLSGHFSEAAELLDALLIFLRRSGSALLTSDVEEALACVKRLLDVGFGDCDSHERVWVPAANELLMNWREVLANPASSGSSRLDSSALGAVDGLVCDLCATCKDVLLLITQDAQLLVERCLESRRSAADFLVAVCAIMTPFAPLSQVADTFRQYMDQWTATAPEEEWWNVSALAVLEAATQHDVVGAMAVVVSSLAEADGGAAAAAGSGAAPSTVGQLNGGVGGDASDVDDDGNDDYSAVSDAVSLSELAAHALPVAPSFARRFTVVCMAAHVADLCAPVGVAASAAEMHLTFTRNDLITAYAGLFAQHSRTWRVAGLYACYSPLVNPSFLVDIVEGVTPLAATDAGTYRSLVAFLCTTWCPHGAVQTAVRAKLQSVLPGNATVEKWWSAVDHYYREAYRTAHHYIITTWWNSGAWGRAAWLAVETGLTETLQSHLRYMLSSAHALASRELYAVGCAVQHGLVGFDTSRAPELTCYLCAAAAVAAYRQAATAVDAAQRGASRTRDNAASSEDVVAAAVGCLQAIQTALTCADACDVMPHPSTTFTLVEHGADLLRLLRQLMCDPTTGDTTSSMDVSSSVLPLLVEAYQLSSIHFTADDPRLAVRSQAVAEKLAHVHQTSL